MSSYMGRSARCCCSCTTGIISITENVCFSVVTDSASAGWVIVSSISNRFESTSVIVTTYGPAANEMNVSEVWKVRHSGCTDKAEHLLLR